MPPLFGRRRIRRSEVPERLGVKDYARVAQLSAEEAFRLLLSKHKQDEQSAWARFETELTKRVGEIKARHNDELHAFSARIKELEAAAKAHDQGRYLTEVCNLFTNS